MRPDEAAALKVLGQKTQAIVGRPQYLEHVAASAAEYEHMAALRIFGQRGVDFGCQTVHPGTHVSDAGGKPDPGAARETDHVRRP